MPDKPQTLTSMGFTPLPSGNTVFVPVTSTTPVAPITEQETLSEKDYRNRLDLRLLKELWGLPLDIKRWRPGRMPYDDVWLAGLHKVHRDPQPFSSHPHPSFRWHLLSSEDPASDPGLSTSTSSSVLLLFVKPGSPMLMSSNISSSFRLLSRNRLLLVASNCRGGS